MDDEYIAKVLSGDDEAFRYFIKKYKQMAFNLAASIVKDSHYAEEIAQDAFLKAFDGLKAFNRKSNFKTWFYRIVVNESFQRLRKMKRELPIKEYADGLESEMEVMSNAVDQIEQVKSVMTGLPPKESLVLNLFYLEENSLKDIAESTGWTLANTKVIYIEQGLN